jgi:hypothetical protein
MTTVLPPPPCENKTTYSNSLFSWIAVLECVEFYFHFLAHRRSLILCTVTTSVIKLGLQTPSLNVCNFRHICYAINLAV